MSVLDRLSRHASIREQKNDKHMVIVSIITRMTIRVPFPEKTDAIPDCVSDTFRRATLRRKLCGWLTNEARRYIKYV
jgi:hypothetical protein